MFCAWTLMNSWGIQQAQSKEIEVADSVVDYENESASEGKEKVEESGLNAKIPSTRHLVFFFVVMPCALTVILWLIGTYATKEYMPNKLDIHLWRNFSNHVKQSAHVLDSKYPHNMLLMLLVLHALQIVFFFPLLHVTKIMYGYFFGGWEGGLICCVWEFALIALFVIIVTRRLPARPPGSDLQGFLNSVASLRDRNLLLPFLVALHISSVPLVTSMCLVLFQVTSRYEFVYSHLIATILTTFKDTWLGHFLGTSDGNAMNIAIAATLLSVSAVLPTVFAITLMAFLSQSATRNALTHRSMALN